MKITQLGATGPQGQMDLGGRGACNMGPRRGLQSHAAQPPPLDSLRQTEDRSEPIYPCGPRVPLQEVSRVNKHNRYACLTALVFSVFGLSVVKAQTVVVLKPRAANGVSDAELTTVGTGAMDTLAREGLRVIPPQDVVARAISDERLNCQEPICAAGVAQTLGADYALALTVWVNGKHRNVTATVADIGGESAGIDVKVVGSGVEALQRAGGEAARLAWSRKKSSEMPELFITTQPGGASVYVDGMPLEGKTSDTQPTAEQMAAIAESDSAAAAIQSAAQEKLQSQVWHRKLEPGLHDVVVELKNYIPQRMKLKVNKKERKLIEFQLKEGQGNIVKWLEEGRALRVAQQSARRQAQKPEAIKSSGTSETGFSADDLREPYEAPPSPANYWVAGGLGIVGAALLVSPILTLLKTGGSSDEGKEVHFGTRSALQLGGGLACLGGAAVFLAAKPIKLPVTAVSGHRTFVLQWEGRF